MLHDYQLTVGDVYRDARGLQVRVDGIDTHNRVHFSVDAKDEQNWILWGEMSQEAFSGRFIKLYHSLERRAA